MLQIYQNEDERQAVNSLLELQNFAQQVQDWKNNYQKKFIQKRDKTKFNFLNFKKNASPEKKQNQNLSDSQNFINISKFRRARSLFDPLKIFKIGLQQLSYNNPQQQKIDYEAFNKKMIHKHPQKIRDLNFKTGHPTKNIMINPFRKQQLNFQQLKNRSKQFVNGESVIIQVQSYEDNFNKKEVQYLMNKTLGPKNFRAHLQKKNYNHNSSLYELKSQDMKLGRNNLGNFEETEAKMQNTQLMEQGSYFKLDNQNKMRNTMSHINKKMHQVQNASSMSIRKQLSSSMNLKNPQSQLKNEQMNISLRNLVNNLKSKTYSLIKNTNHKYDPYRKTNGQGIMITKKEQQIGIHNGDIKKDTTKIFDRQAIFRDTAIDEWNYNRNELKRLNNRVKRSKEILGYQQERGGKNQNLRREVEEFSMCQSQMTKCQKIKQKYYQSLKQKRQCSNSKTNSLHTFINTKNGVKNNNNEYTNEQKLLRISSPKKYYQNQKVIGNNKIKEDQRCRNQKIFNVKKIG